jgi:hypothetical protein
LSQYQAREKRKQSSGDPEFHCRFRQGIHPCAHLALVRPHFAVRVSAIRSASDEAQTSG